MTSETVKEDEAPITVKEAVVLLSSLLASQVLPVLRHTDFAMVAGLAFAGFRQDASGYGNPVVRRRLAEEAAKNPYFAKKLRELSKQPAPIAPPTVAAQSKAGPIPSAAASIAAQAARDTEKYRAERDRLKVERDSAITTKLAAERILTEAKRELTAAQNAKTEAEKEADRLRQRYDRLERKQRQLEATNASLRRAAIQSPAAPSAASPAAPIQAPAAVEPAQQNHFAEAVRHLLGKQRETIALSIVADVLRASPNDFDALEIKADALIRQEKPKESIPVLRSLIPILLKYEQIKRAASALAKLLTVSQQPAQESKLIREFMAAIPRSTESLTSLTEPLNALKVDNPESFAVLKSLTPSAWAAQIFPEQTFYPPESPLPLVLSSTAGMILTARKLVTAIDRNDWPIVELAQEALKKKDEDERKKILESVIRAADGDKIYSTVLTPKYSRGAIVVDSSNVAWHGQENAAQPQPRLSYVLAVRRTLWQRGYFPVILVADANFPFVINDPPNARRLIDDEQIHLVTGGSDADEHILREAQRLTAPIVTNDYMVDWDPEQNVVKIQYTISPDGKPTVYF